ncbi:MAG: F0F1 ATP synthase subunit delta [SAR202 cluster bacterium]|nr:hypothetical protein [Chloroflexota bacterium]MQG50776.1 F0F1 ATP synthase subunit delta [SAR202 cluster bacterium]|tara:strand:- start:2403 stop:2933 length:531 start_codon:yes stop_codon:yes gene_type:complete
MAKGPKAKRYAEAAFQIAENSGDLQEWASQLSDLSQLMADESVYSFVSSAKVPLQDKLSVLNTTMKGFNPLIGNLVCLLAIRNSIGLIGTITEEFNKLVDAASGVARAEIYTAVDLNKEQQSKIEESISKGLNSELQVSYNKDPELLGGLVVRVNDLVIDGSIQEKLVGLKRQIGK